MEVGSLRPGEIVVRITSVAFHCLNKSLWDDTLPEGALGGPLDPQGPTAQPYEAGYQGSPGAGGLVEHPCASLQKLLGTGTFYYALGGDFDLSRRLDQRTDQRPLNTQRRKPPPPPATNAAVSATSTRSSTGPHSSSTQWDYDPRFVWNTYMMEPLQEYRSRLDAAERDALDQEALLLLTIQGFVGSFEIGDATIALVSRLSWKRAGTRYNTRGIDDDGNVANFAESETLYSAKDSTMSYVQTRGSVPLFWEQQGLQAFNARIQVTRSRAASQPAFDRHFSDLLAHYKHVHALNLLGTRDAETVLASAYAEHMRNSEAEEMFLAALSKEDGIIEAEQDPMDRIGLTNFDFHTVTRLNSGIDGMKRELRRLEAVQLKLHTFGYTLVGPSGALLRRQRGVFRTNCLDCLDRTNVVQDILSQDALQLCIDSANDGSGLPDAGSNLWTHHRVLWAENGDAISRIYAGTGALNTSSTRTGVGKKTLGGLLSDAAKSASRLYINNFQDKSKQNVIDALLGNMANQRPVSVFDPLQDSVNAELISRMDEYSTEREVSVFTGTWNLAGNGPSGENLESFLFPTASEPDVLAIGLQEVVPLTPQQILLTDPDKLRMWEAVISSCIAKRKDAKARYIPLRSEQLVGTALIVMIKDTMLPYVRQVEAATKKTGLRGMSGNKGGVAIRMNIYDTSFCFVTAHFAAGKSNVEERNADFATISRELTFFSGRTISNCSYAFWFGDFNYRIDGGNEIVRPMCDARDIDGLARRDQLLRAQASRQAFFGCSEGPLTFLPTYKYDFNSHIYDTSEKLRVPAWTDRVLVRADHPFRAELKQYNRAELLTSDHRPVYALFSCGARLFDSEKRNGMRRELLIKYKGLQGRNGSLLDEYSSEDESGSDHEGNGDDDGYPTDELPEPSSGSTSNWWDKPLSGGEDSDDNNDGTIDADGHQRNSMNPFANRAQYARRPKQMLNTTSPQALSSAASSVLDVASGVSTGDSLARDNGGIEAARSSRTSSTLSASAEPSSAMGGTAARRRPPQPPKRLPAQSSTLSPANAPTNGELTQIDFDKATPDAVKAEAGPHAGALTPAPPPIPAKPGSIVTADKAAEASQDTSLPLPKRPQLGSRSQSYQSQCSLLDRLV